MDRRGFIVLGAASVLSGCGVDSTSASDEEIKRAIYRHNGTPRLTLYTMINNRSGAGAHTSMLINASQRVIWDPAGSFRSDSIIVRGDVVYGITPYVEDFYVRFHARETYHVMIQEMDVSADLAERVLRAFQAHGAVPKAHCANSTTSVLKALPEFQSLDVTYYPVKFAEQFGQFPGVRSRSVYEYDADDKTKVLRDYVPVAKTE